MSAQLIARADIRVASTTKGRNAERFGELDGFRGCALLAIVFLHYIVHHLTVIPGTPLAYACKYAGALWIAVDAFFVLSGFLIGGILIDQKRSQNFFRVFYLRRALRIFPPYVMLLTLWLLARGAFLRTETPGMHWLLERELPVWTYFAYLQNFWMAARENIGALFVAPTWSLAIEEQFYLLFPLVVWLTPTRLLPQCLALGIACAPLLRLGLSLGGIHAGQVYLLPSRWDSLLIGACVAWLVRTPAAVAWLMDRRRSLRTATMLAGGLVACVPFVPTAPSGGFAPAAAVAVYLGIALFFGLIIIELRLCTAPRLARLLSSPFLRYFGKISYTVYLLHVAVLGAVFAIGGRDPDLATSTDWLLAAVAFLTTVLIAESTWRLFESRLISIGRKHAYRV